MRQRRPPASLTPLPSRRAIGDRGEDEAVVHLVEHGVEVLARNVRYGDGEIDVVGRLGTHLLFVEVRLRRDDSRGTPLESVTRPTKVPVAPANAD